MSPAHRHGAHGLLRQHRDRYLCVAPAAIAELTVRPASPAMHRSFNSDRTDVLSADSHGRAHNFHLSRARHSVYGRGQGDLAFHHSAYQTEAIDAGNRCVGALPLYRPIRELHTVRVLELHAELPRLANNHQRHCRHDPDGSHRASQICRAIAGGKEVDADSTRGGPANPFPYSPAAGSSGCAHGMFGSGACQARGPCGPPGAALHHRRRAATPGPRLVGRTMEDDADGMSSDAAAAAA